MRALCGESLLLSTSTETLTQCRSTMDLLMLTVVNSNERGPKFYFSGYEPAEGLPYVDD